LIYCKRFCGAERNIERESHPEPGEAQGQDAGSLPAIENWVEFDRAPVQKINVKNQNENAR